ncbi:MAG TPA: mechanosensitive ion channel domain-containing protein, partial [Xanthomonadales bacterium]|nr:mechanosensitive ion channel domain-containing protein [Xanthomonadales bacterium]
DATAAGGICRVQFGWPEQRCKAVSGLMTWLLVRLLPVAFLASFLVQVEQQIPQAVLGRLMLSIVAIMVALKVHRMLVRQRQRAGEAEPQSSRGFPPWLQNSLLIGLTGALLAIMSSGFLLPARIIYYSLSITAGVLVGLVFLHEMLMRWLLVARRRIRFQQLMATQPGEEGEEKAEKEARQASLGDISDATENLIKSLAYASGLIAIVLIWSPLLPAIQGLQRFTLWTVNQTVNGEQLQTHITVATLVLATLVFVVTFYAARRIPALIDLVMRSSGKSTPSTRYTVSTLTNYLIIAVGIMVFFSTLKMSWSQLQWLVAALGVGIGFGLQEIVANFISGLIILFERPIRVGDVVTIGQSEGTVTRIQIRATTIRDWDGKELLVPNKEFVTGRLLNWSLTDTNNRIVLDVGIAYGSDVEAAMKLLAKVVNAHPSVLKDPAPNILLVKFGESTLNLSARCFLGNLDDRLKHVSEMNQQIYKAFSEAGIVIAYPQLDVHIDPDSPLTVRLQKEA